MKNTHTFDKKEIVKINTLLMKAKPLNDNIETGSLNQKKDKMLVLLENY